jgi:hypothetical protein
VRTRAPLDPSFLDELTVLCFEIFTEKIYDLLVWPRKSANAAKVSLGLTRDAKGRTAVEGIAECQISKEAQTRVLIQTANAERHKAETTYNLNSSRSHVVYSWRCGAAAASRLRF